MSAAENVRSFWAAKTRADSPLASSPRLREGPTMEGLRSTLQRTKSWEKAKNLPRTSPPKIAAMPTDIVTKSPFKEQDQNASSGISPSAFKISMNTSHYSPPESFSLKRADSPTKSSFASPEIAKYGALSRSKSVTFNEQPEVRHMSDCSFETASTPYSTPEHRKYSSDEDCADESDDSIYTEQTQNNQNHSWTTTIPTQKSLPSLDDPFDSSNARALPAIPGSNTGPRPLPTVPVQMPHSPGEKILATEQEESRKALSGLGLQLANNSTLALSPAHDTNGLRWNADEAVIRRNSQRGPLEQDDSDDEHETEAALTTATVQKVAPTLQSASDSSATSIPASDLPKLKTFSNPRSPEPAISKEYIKARLAQRKANQETEQEALRPNTTLAPPLPHFDSFAKLSPTAAVDALQTVEPDSPNFDTNFPSTVVLQRKVSDTHRPVTPTEQLQTTIAEPQSARSVHHEREKRLSSEITSTMLPVTKPVFAAVNYDGDDYDEDFDGRAEDDLIIHPVPSVPSPTPAALKASRLADIEDANVESQAVSPVIPDQDSMADNVISASQELTEDNAGSEPPVTGDIHTAESAPHTPVISSFDFGGLSLSLDFDTDVSDTLGLEQYMTPEKRPETPIAFRTVAPPSPTKSSFVEDSIPEIPIKAEAATITARGMKLRTRPSLTPADTTELAARRRKVSSEIADVDMDIDYGHGAVLGRVRSDSVLSVTLDASHSAQHREGIAEIETPSDEEGDPMSRIQPIAMPVLEPLKREMSFSDINSAFDRVMQKQKKGYVVRQQSRTVHASTSHDEDVPALPNNLADTKGHTRQSSSVYTDISSFSTATKKSSENYNAHRRQGSRIPLGVHMSPKPVGANATHNRRIMPGPLNGGRLFVKVMNIKNLTLPVPKGEESFFCCTLDNGKHCVTTPWHTLSANTKINQEFELIADHDLEFILTLQAQYTPPTMPTRPKSTIGRLLHSPKKHRPTGSITSLSLAGYVGNDGSFARAHMALKHFRDQAFGRPHTLLVPVLNEWAIEATGTGPKGAALTRQRKPYKIGAIELQLLYVPPVGAEHRQLLPTSLSQAARELRDAEWHNKQHCEGYLSQQGGDCPYWRRRHFKLVGSKLTAYHANSGQIRATINLSKATSVTDDRESLIAPDVSTGSRDSKKRRKSGFAEREEGHLYVSEGFRIRFANGEAIDFYADSAADKAKWMEVLEGLVGKVPLVREWCRVVLESEGTTQTLPAKE